jgi:UDP-N-acetylglucosamine:LPS N-acetylglucosamine transferase
MAKILFAWEIGEGSGHIAPYLKVINALEENGHEIYFAVKNLSKSYNLFKGSKVRYIQAPSMLSPDGELVNPIDSYAKILNNSGYSSIPQLAGLIGAWRHLFALIEPDLIIADYCPTAVLASRESGIPRLQIATGFYIIPKQGRTPNLFELQGLAHDNTLILGFKNKILSNINAALELNDMQKIAFFNDTQDCQRTLFRTFKEFDHYPNREASEYIGLLNASQGVEPQWPDASGPKVFGYLKPFPSLPQLLMQLKQRQCATLIYPDGIAEKLIREYQSDTLKFIDQPLDIRAVGRSADFAIHNGNHGTACEVLLAGLPSLVLPNQAEQAIMGQRLTQMKTGVSTVDKTADELHAALNTLCDNTELQENARAFSEKYKDFDRQAPINRIIEVVEEMLS